MEWKRWLPIFLSLLSGLIGGAGTYRGFQEPSFPVEQVSPNLVAYASEIGKLSVERAELMSENVRLRDELSRCKAEM